ncbi:phosphonate metabolism protein/1,5-bisphosphokinase (PRPP-forming) PhnN [Allopusillimonas soli]|nr:phosphonate metabolism protein/1,5-bisphosphokinase (PRPP-forming) PhnN [Allopusillimonas soli]
MGPSGAGKDAVLRGVAQRMGAQAFIASRVITRPPSSTEDGAMPVSSTEFEIMEAAGLFALSWRANELAYGILRHIDIMLARGRDVFVNGSRAYLPHAALRYPRLVPVLLTVEPALLRDRLLSRGRETRVQIEARLARNNRFEKLSGTAGTRLLHIDNSGALENAIHALHAGLLAAQGEAKCG